RIPNPRPPHHPPAQVSGRSPGPPPPPPLPQRGVPASTRERVPPATRRDSIRISPGWSGLLDRRSPISVRCRTVVASRRRSQGTLRRRLRVPRIIGARFSEIPPFGGSFRGGRSLCYSTCFATKTTLR